MPEPFDPGPETQPSLQARPDPLETEPTPDPEEPSAVDSVAIAEPEAPPSAPAPAGPKHAAADTDPETDQEAPVRVPAQRVVVPGQYRYLKRWTFVLVLIGVWVPAAVVGLGLYYYWFHSLHKTPAVFVVLMFVIVCTLAAQLLAMVEQKPLVTAVSMALLSAPFAATAAAAALYGAYVFHWIPR